MADLVLGPSGGNGGHEFGDYVLPSGAKIHAVRVNAGLYIDGIQVIYRDASGQVVEMRHLGGQSGWRHTFTLDDDEYVTGVSGRSGNYIDSLRIHTNKRTSEQFGGPSGANEYHFEASGSGEIAGLVGRAGWYIDQLGVVVRDRSAAAPAAAAPEPAASAEPAAASAAAAARPAAKAASKSRKKSAPETGLVAIPDAPPVAAPAPDLVAIPESAPVAPEAPNLIGIPDSAPVAATAPEYVGIPDSAPIAVESAATVAGKRTESVDLGTGVAADDLTRIEGIGPKIAQVLADAGITSYAQLAATPGARLREVLNAAGSRYRITDPSSWPEQAALAAAGDWSGLKAKAAELKGGRKV